MIKGGMAHKIAPALLSSALLIIGCSVGQEPDSTRRANQLADLAPDPSQAALWRKVAESEAGAGLEDLPLQENPISNRQRVVIPDQRLAPAERLPSLDEVVVTVLVVSGPALEEGRFVGSAEVTEVDGERLALDLGGDEPLVLLVRVREGPLRVEQGEQVELEYEPLVDIHAARELIALRASNDEVLSVLESSDEPIRLTVESFGLTARQLDGGKTPPVDVTVEDTTERFSQGDIRRFPNGLVVALVASEALTGADAHRAEGNPFAIRLLAWAGS